MELNFAGSSVHYFYKKENIRGYVKQNYFLLHLNNIGPADKDATERTTTATTTIKPLLELPNNPSEINHLTDILQGLKRKGNLKNM